MDSYSAPIAETEQLRTKQFKLEPGFVRGRNKTETAIEAEYPLYEIDLVFEFDPEEEGGVEFGFILESNKHEKLIAAFNTMTRQVFITRDSSGIIDFSEHFSGMHTATYQVSKEGEIRFHAFVDLSSIELFVDQGALAMTELCFPESGFEKIHLYSNKESVRLKKGDIYSLKSIW